MSQATEEDPSYLLTMLIVLFTGLAYLLALLACLLAACLLEHSTRGLLDKTQGQTPSGLLNDPNPCPLTGCPMQQDIVHIMSSSSSAERLIAIGTCMSC